MSNKLEQLEFKLEKIIGIQKHKGKVRKTCLEKHVFKKHFDFLNFENNIYVMQNYKINS